MIGLRWHIASKSVADKRKGRANQKKKGLRGFVSLGLGRNSTARGKSLDSRASTS